MRLIDADKLKKYLDPQIQFIIDHAPTIDAVPVVHARWAKLGTANSGSLLICTACNYSFRRLFPKNFCPNCGAKMDGDPHDSC